MKDWILVDGYERIPLGKWLVYIEDIDQFQVATVHKNITVIGGHFGFDMHKVTHYQALPEGPTTKED